MKRSNKSQVKLLLANADQLVLPPPSDLTAPVPPVGFVPRRAGGRGLKPKMAELAVLTGCIDELARFSGYARTFGALAPPPSQIAQAFDAAGQWTRLRFAAKTFLAYVLAEEGTAWKATRGSLDKLKVSFGVAVGNDPSLAIKYPNLKALFVVGKDIGKKIQASRKKNAKTKAPGAAPAAPAASTAAAIAPGSQLGIAVNGVTHP